MRDKSVCIVGAGISGITIANALAVDGVSTHLIDRNPYPGGRAAWYGCKAVDECVHCGVCLIRDAIADLKRNPSIKQYYSSMISRAEQGADGSFSAVVDTKPNPVDQKKCVDCGECVDACPSDSIERLTGWGIFVNDTCTECGKCVDACSFDAIAFDRERRSATLSASEMVIATGFTPYNPALNRKWGFGSNDRVLSGSDLERLFYDESYIPVTGEADIAFVQCVGSRNVTEGLKSCSRVCCAYALRMANRMAAEYPALRVDFYYMDLQYFGKDYETFMSGVKERINLIRSNPVSVSTDDRGFPVLRYESFTSRKVEERAYDYLVLSNGITPDGENAKTADMFGLNLTDEGFLSYPGGDGDTIPASYVNRPVLLAGTATGPLGIAESAERALEVSAILSARLQNRAVKAI